MRLCKRRKGLKYLPTQVPAPWLGDPDGGGSAKLLGRHQLLRERMQRAADNMQQTACSRQRAADNMQQTTCNRQHATCNRQHATDNMQQTTCSRQHAADNMQQITCSRQHAADNMQPTTCNRQHATDNMQQTTCSRQHAADNMQQTTCSSCRQNCSASVAISHCGSVRRIRTLRCGLSGPVVERCMLRVVWCMVHVACCRFRGGEAYNALLQYD
jgi:hypothetical protein